MKFIDMFSGIGTVRMGFEKAGWECVYSIEWDKHKRGIYSVIFGEEPQGRDIRAVGAAELPRADCWTFGAPCQDFSIAGKREGLEGDRSSLVREVFRLVRELKEEHRPEWLLYENVKGMFSSNKGFDFFEILFEMESLGYDIQWQLLNTKDFGVPQNRERVFTLGHLRRCGRREIFPIERSYKSTDELQGQSLYTNTLTTRTQQANGSGSYIVESQQHAQTVRIKDNVKKGYSEATLGDGIRLDHIDGKTGRGRVQKQVSPTLTTSCQSGVLVNHIIGSMQKNAFVGDGSLCPTLTGAMGKGGGQIPMVEYTNYRIRRLTPRECWRLQGISDEITDRVIAAGISDTQMYRGAGDACTVNVIYEIARRL